MSWKDTHCPENPLGSLEDFTLPIPGMFLLGSGLHVPFPKYFPYMAVHVHAAFLLAPVSWWKLERNYKLERLYGFPVQESQEKWNSNHH